jgi:hypothetical protein
MYYFLFYSLDPVNFPEGGTSMFFCKARSSPCVFPFTFEGEEHKECAEYVSSGGEGGEIIRWCATKVDDQGVMMPGFWGRCDLSTCTEGDRKKKGKNL